MRTDVICTREVVGAGGIVVESFAWSISTCARHGALNRRRAEAAVPSHRALPDRVRAQTDA